jgi:hypothetical protein
MRIYRNQDQSYDVVNDNNVLFHLHNGCIKVIGRVTNNWRHQSRIIQRLPARYSRYVAIIQKKTITN